MKYEYPECTDVISGFGGGYEKTCQQMVIKGMRWFDKHPDAKPEFSGYKGIYGVISEDNADAKSLSDFITEGVDCTGAMHQACIQHILYAHKVGWEQYLKEALVGND